jgi:hypothetical protein
LVVGFAPNDPDGVDMSPVLNSEAAVGDDAISLRFSNKDHEFARLLYDHQGGVRIEVFRHYPQLNSGAGVSVSLWWGHLNTPERGGTSNAWVNVTASAGFRSSKNIVPWPAHGNCEHPYGMEMPVGERTSEFTPCDYDPDDGRGEVDPETDEAYPTCKKTEAECMLRWEEHWKKKFGGQESAVQTEHYGADGRGISRSQGAQTFSDTPANVVCGTVKVYGAHVLDYRKEPHPDDDDQDAGTLLTLSEFSLGPVEAITDVKALDSDMPRPGGLGLVVRLGEQDQEPTGFLTNGLGHNRRAVVRTDNNPIDPMPFTRANINISGLVEGINDVPVYSDEDTYTRTWTDLRAWHALNFFTRTWYGWGLSPDYFVKADFIRLAAGGSKFNCVVRGQTMQQLVRDLAGPPGWYLPTWHNGLIRWTAQEALDYEAPDIPTFTDTGSQRNILIDAETGESRLFFDYARDDSLTTKIPVVFMDGPNLDYKERTIFVSDPELQKRFGQVNNNSSVRPTTQPFAAYGMVTQEEAAAAGKRILHIGAFGDGGYANNCMVTMEVPPDDPDGVNLHVNKVFKLVSPKADAVEYRNLDGEPFTHYRVKKLVHEPTRIIVYAVAYAEVPIEETLPETCGEVTLPTKPFGAVKPGDNISFIFQFDTVANPFTLAGWCKFATKVPIGSYPGDPLGGAGLQTIVSSGIRPSGAPAYSFPTSGWLIGRDEATHEIFLVCDNGPMVRGPEIDNGTWCYVAITLAGGDGAARKLYVNGLPVLETTGNQQDLTIDNQPFLFFTNLNGFFLSDYYGGLTNGGLTRWNAWNRLYTDDEILADYEGRSFVPCDTTDWWGGWPLEDASYDLLTGTPSDNDISPNCRPLVQSFGIQVNAASDAPGLNLYCTLGPRSGGTVTPGTVSPSRAVLIDRLWRTSDLSAGVPGFYFAAAPTDTSLVWSRCRLYRDVGLGFEEIAQATTRAVLGEAVDVLLATELGTETVQVELLDPDGELASYTTPEIAAGAGKVFLGGEIFQYQTATQISTSPNIWELSDLSNRGAYCTADAQATHVAEEDFVLLNSAVVFVPVEQSELGETRQYKPLTGGGSLASTSAQSFTLSAPNFVITSPSDYVASFDATRNVMRHTWTPIALTDCLDLTGLQYEIYLDAGGGTPGAFVWRGDASEFTELLAASGTRSYVFRVRTNYAVGAWETDSETFTLTGGGGGTTPGRWEPLTDGDTEDPQFIFDDGDVVMVWVTD